MRVLESPRDASFRFCFPVEIFGSLSGAERGDKMTRRTPLTGAALAVWVAVLLLVLPLAAADFSTEPGVPAPDGVPDAVKALVNPEGIVVKGPDGKVNVQIWPRKAAFEGDPASGFGIRMKTIPEGALIALVNYPNGSSDYREQSVPAGIYTMRYALHPEDGNHMGVASSRDFGVLTPIDKDTEPSKNLAFKDLVAHTKMVGNPHPTVVRLEMAESSDTPHMWQDDSEHWVLDLDVAGEPVGFVVHGHSEE
jgi:hypothetical protein